MKKVLFYAVLAALCANAGYDTTRYYKNQQARQKVVKALAEQMKHDNVKRITVHDCHRFVDEWVCDVELSDGETVFRMTGPIPDEAFE